MTIVSGSDVRWLEVKVETTGEFAEAASALLHRHCPGGVAIERAVLPDDDHEGAYTEAPDGLTAVRAYLPMDATLDTSRQALEVGLWHLRQLLPDEPAFITFTEVHEEDWAHAWKAHYHALTIGSFLVVPAWEEPDVEAGQFVLRLDPGMAFGTGVHASTQLMLCAVERVVANGFVVADVGTGSGILAIAAALRGAEHVDAVDLEAVAIESTRHDSALNGVERRIHARQGSVELLQAGGYDIVLANIIAPVIAGMIAGLRALLAPGGVLLVSGIIANREDLVLDAATANGMQVSRRDTQNDWVCLELRPV
jgi:ribosomal protein L11 methyltransferase